MPRPIPRFEHPHCDERDPVVALLLSLHGKVDWIMATMQEVLDDINKYVNDVTAYIAARDAADADLRNQLAAALAAAGGAATQDQVDAAFAAIEAARPV